MNLGYIHTKHGMLTDLGCPNRYSTHGGSTNVLLIPFANPRAPKKWSAWFPNRPENNKIKYKNFYINAKNNI